MDSYRANRQFERLLEHDTLNQHRLPSPFIEKKHFEKYPQYEKFHPGDIVKIVRLLDTTTKRELIGMRGIIEEVDELPNGDYNYFLADGTYVHEEELELDIPGEVLWTMAGKI
jgi:hypothetical protein